MPLYTLTVRVLDAGGQVTAVRQAPFFVCGSAEEDLEQAAADLEQAARDLEEAAADLAAEHDEQHHHHHWWVP